MNHEHIQLPLHTSILTRAGHALQFGTLPETATILELPTHVNPAQASAVFSAARRPIAREVLARGLSHCGIPLPHAQNILSELLRARILRPCPPAAAGARGGAGSGRAGVRGAASRASGRAPGAQSPTPPRTRGTSAPPELTVLHTGLVTQRLEPLLRTQGVTFGLSHKLSEVRGQLVVMPGMLFPPVDMQHNLMEKLIVHLPFGSLDGAAVIGPLVVPGVTACLSCIDHHYSRIDAGWQGMRAQAAARPQPSSKQVVEGSVAMASALISEQLLPWWRARDGVIGGAAGGVNGGVAGGLSGGATADLDIPEALRSRRIYNFSTGELRVEHIAPDPQCRSCRSVRLSYA